MKVKNQKCIRRLSYKSLWATRKRNVIAIFAIALTTLLFTSLFTILMSLNESYETYNFRQVGGYSDGTFKELSEEQVEKIAAHPGSGKPENASHADSTPQVFLEKFRQKSVIWIKTVQNGAMRHRRQEENLRRAMRSQWTRLH